MKKTWIIEYSQNQWEYSDIIKIKAEVAEKTGLCTITVDGVEMEFSEPVREPQLIEDYEDFYQKGGT